MSHLSILPTVFTDLERLVQALCDEGFTVERSGGVGSAELILQTN